MQAAYFRRANAPAASSPLAKSRSEAGSGTVTGGADEIAPTASMSAPTVVPLVASRAMLSVSRTKEKKSDGPKPNASISTPFVAPVTAPTLNQVARSSLKS